MEDTKKGEVQPENESEQINSNVNHSNKDTAKESTAKNGLAMGPAIIIGAIIIAGAVLISQRLPGNISSGTKSKTIISELGISEKMFKACYDSKQTEAKVREDIASAERATAHIPEEQGRGTPYSVVIHKKTGVKAEIAGAYPIEAAKGIINGLLQGTSKSQTEINIDPVTDKDHYFGSKDADVVVIEYSDLECPFCARFHNTMHQIVTDYNGQVAWVYRHLPLESLHPNAFSKAVSAECVSELGGDTKFWSYIDSLFKGIEPKKPVFDPITGETK